MKAIQIKEFGNSEVLQYVELPKPSVKENEVLIKVSVAGINFADIMVRRGFYPMLPTLPAVIGSEVAGVVEELGAGISHLKKGQRIIALCDAAYAAYAVANVNQVFPIPDALVFEVATAFLIQGLTAKNLIENVPFKSVLIHAAAGGVGSIAVQLAKQKGALVIGLASKEKHEYLKGLGADYAFTYEANTLVENVKKVTDNKGVDLILDTAGGEIGTESIKAGGSGSTLISYGTISGQPTIVHAHNLIFLNQTVKGTSLYSVQPAQMGQWFGELVESYLSGNLKIETTAFNLEDAAKAHTALENRETKGKVILKID